MCTSKKRRRDDDDDAAAGGHRNKRAREANAPVLSGPLAGRLREHAYQRCRHFFLYLLTIKLLEFLSNARNPNARVNALAGLAVKATDQIDDGFRVEASEYADFDNDDEGIIFLPTTAFKKMDAAHFCNLGIKPGFAQTLDRANQIIADLYELLKTIAGNTQWLPQRVNIGPDRRIDILHGKLAEEMLSDGFPVCSRRRIELYAVRATETLQEYAVECVKKKKRGVAACARCYTARYAEPDFVQSILSELAGGQAGWAAATDNWEAFKFVFSRE